MEFYIVGCGPGDKELLTIKAFKIIKDAKTILYDNLVSKEVLSLANSSCLKVYVGKKPYQNSITQEKINDLIKFYALSRGNVVRLKGGDPYIFGRGFEELEFARENGIKATYIPGISSMQTCGLNDIPLTYRGISEGFWVITGTRRDGSLSTDLYLAVQSKATIVIYMGMSKLAEISQIYSQAGKGSIQACIIENGSLPNQRKAFCKVEDLNITALTEGLGNPAIIVIGGVVELATDSKILDKLLTNHGLNAIY
ncbi:uroporphyrinogen-III C-methyltransferase [Albibacterium bauzanense]|uniref:uroporphyrinogen-III C-methyltransferase n=1 Tax=Albibacterium bauzanense TaxID=653929 RepID=A0A4V2PX61_9SPHI|nr:uroporphyrinogen-III C-methyltransferase [Albibacterium bauzanense]TCK80851.1 uroporphyrin-III C-methyltransferase [Albibacterium bauzanense]